MKQQQPLWFLAVFLAQGDAFTSPHLVSRSFAFRYHGHGDNNDFGCLATLDQNGHSHEALMTRPDNDTTEEEQRPACYYKSPSSAGRWKPRIELSELSIGQELPDAVVVQELIEGKTGPKVFVDCGVGRFSSRRKGGGWKIQTAMLRLNERKKSVAVKRAARLRRKEYFPVYVSRIRLDNDQLEVCLNPEDVAQYQEQQEKKRISVSNLKQGQECVGTVERVLDYGVLVNVGANRRGLLHIQRVADLNGRFVNKADGLIEAGLERGARIKVQVLEPVQKKRLFLDFTEDVKQNAREETEKQKEAQQGNEVMESDRKDSLGNEASVTPSGQSTLSSDPYAEYAQEAAAYQKQNQAVAGEVGYDDDEVDDDEYDDYDEDRDIEDALGLGTY